MGRSLTKMLKTLTANGSLAVVNNTLMKILVSLIIMLLSWASAVFLFAVAFNDSANEAWLLFMKLLVIVTALNLLHNFYLQANLSILLSFLSFSLLYGLIIFLTPSSLSVDWMLKVILPLSLSGLLLVVVYWIRNTSKGSSL